MILLIDNYDSFVHNLARYFKRLGQETLVVRNDAITVSQVRELAPTAIVLSPGPCGPLEAGCSVEVVAELWQQTPILGVCLGHQAIAAAFSGKIIRAREPWHGRSSAIIHDGSGVFANLPSPIMVGRYHSLVVAESTLPPQLRVTARTASGEIMAIEQKDKPVFGVQFHPESVLTEHGAQLLANFLRICGLGVAEFEHAAEVAQAPFALTKDYVRGTPISF